MASIHAIRHSVQRARKQSQTIIGQSTSSPTEINLLLPTEIMLKILSLLNFCELNRCALVCEQWKDLSRDSSLWKKHFQQYFHSAERGLYFCSGIWLRKRFEEIENIGHGWWDSFVDAFKIKELWQNKTIKYSTLKLLPKKRAYACSGFDTLGRIFVLGGWDDTNKCNKEMMLQVYDMKTMKYHVPEMWKGFAPNCRAGMSCISLPHKNQLIYFGGQFIAKQPQKIYNDVFILDTITMTWTKPVIKGTPPSPRAWATAELVDNKIFIFGGGGFDFLWKEACLYNDVFMLDLNSDVLEWRSILTKGEKPCPRAGHTSSVLNGTDIIIHAGGNLGGSQVFGDTFLLNTRTSTWKKLVVTGDVPGPMGSLNSCVVGTTFYSFGGWHGTIDGIDQGSVNTLYALDTVTSKWSVISPSGDLELVCRSGSAACFCAGKWFVFGGINNTNRIIADVVVFEPQRLESDSKKTKTRARSERGGSVEDYLTFSRAQ
eukprot:TRINITY_DN912_c0_g1_i1.p1 TRINITY_DN912_c0_g1~~TRINITY_DN912_c0_g1_i1.p1  ORF type:complete len:486 (+),score=46.48 TRINITY_DN912_c0_g1_i1:120-1577(+)